MIDEKSAINGFNEAYKIIFNNRLMPTLKAMNVIPNETIGVGDCEL